MPITLADIQIRAPQRLTDDPDGGGFMTSVIVQDGVENNLFTDISSFDRATGRVQMRKAFAAVLSADTDMFLGSHVMISDPPSDPAVTSLLVKMPEAGYAFARTGYPAQTVYPQEAERIHVQDYMETVLTGNGPYYGCVPVIGTLAALDTDIPVDDIRVQLVPKTLVPVPVSGSASPSSASVDSRDFYIQGDVINPDPVYVSRAEVYPNYLPAPDSVRYQIDEDNDSTPFDVNATFEADENGVLPETEAGSGVITEFTLVSPEDNRVDFQLRQRFRDTQVGSHGGRLIYRPAMFGRLPVVSTVVNAPTISPGQAYGITLGGASERGSELIQWVSGGVTKYLHNNGGPGFFPGRNYNSVADASFPDNAASALISRTTNQVECVLVPTPDPGSEIRVDYVPTGNSYPLSLSAVSGSFNAGRKSVTVTGGRRLMSLQFRLSNDMFGYMLPGSDAVYTQPAAYDGQGNYFQTGSYDRNTNEIVVPSIPDGTTITEIYALETPTNLQVTELTVTIETNLIPSTMEISGTQVAGGTPFTSTPNSSGVFSGFVTGSYDPNTGVLALVFDGPVNTPVAYTADQAQYTGVPGEYTGLVETAFPADGKVTCFRTGDLVVVHHTATTAPATAVNGGNVNVGRTNLAKVRVFGDDDLEIFTGFTVNLATGVVTWVNVAGYSQPVRVEHRIEDMAVQVGYEGGAIRLNRPLSKAYPSGTLISSCPVYGDLQAQVHLGFQQQTWAGTFADTPVGAAITADYNEVSSPIQVTNEGAISERWACIFTNTTTFRVIGEQVGEILQGNTGVNTAPVNPSTGVPYFTIPAAGWGTGWVAGNVYRFNTEGAAAPVWAIRCCMPSEAFGEDSVTLAIRGDIDN